MKKPFYKLNRIERTIHRARRSWYRLMLDLSEYPPFYIGVMLLSIAGTLWFYPHLVRLLVDVFLRIVS